MVSSLQAGEEGPGFRSGGGNGLEDAQCYSKGLGLSLLDSADFCLAVRFCLLLLALVPVYVLILLPSASGGVDAVSQVVLWERMSAIDLGKGQLTHLPILVSGDVGPLEFSLTTARSSSYGLVHCLDAERNKSE